MGHHLPPRRPKSCFVKRVLKLTTKAGYGRTVSNIQGREFQMMGAATGKLQDRKPVWTRGKNNKIEPEERKV